MSKENTLTLMSKATMGLAKLPVATPEEIASTEAEIARPLPGTLKDFYETASNGLRFGRLQIYWKIKMTISKRNIELLLRSAGWYPGRSIDIGFYVDVCKSEGYKTGLAAREFMTCYGGLTVTHPSYAGDENDYSILDPEKAIATVFFERTESYRKRSIEKEILCPVGVGFSEHLVYFVGESGKFYGGFDDYFCLIGTDSFDAFDNIFNRHSFSDLSMP